MPSGALFMLAGASGKTQGGGTAEAGGMKKAFGWALLGVGVIGVIRCAVGEFTDQPVEPTWLWGGWVYWLLMENALGRIGGDK